MLENRRSSLLPLGSNLAMLQSAVAGADIEQHEDGVSPQLRMCIQSAQDLRSATSSSAPSLLSNFETAALEVQRSCETMPSGESPRGFQLAGVLTGISDASLQDYTVGLVYLVSSHALQPHVAAAASSLLLLLGKVA